MGPRYVVDTEDKHIVFELDGGTFECGTIGHSVAHYLAEYLNKLNDQIEAAKAEGNRVAVDTLMAIASAPPVMVETPLGPLPLLTTTVVDLATRLHDLETERQVRLTMVANALRPLSTSATADEDGEDESPF
jgi:hypothetical protein